MRGVGRALISARLTVATDADEAACCVGFRCDSYPCEPSSDGAS